MAKFVVVIPAYNAARYLPDTVGSVQAQDAADWEIIVADDGSTDETAAVMARLAAADPRIRWLSQPNAGVSAARNLGARHLPADCRYVWFLDSDDMLAPGALRRLGDYLDSHPAVGLLACQFQLVRDDGTPAGPGSRSRWAAGGPFNLPRQLPEGELPTPFETFFCGTGQGPFALYRRSVFERTEGWEPGLRYFEDSDMFCQMALLAEVHFLPDRLYVKRIHAGQSTNTDNEASAGGIWEGYASFREKWDRRPGRDERATRRLEAARRFYRNRFLPARDMKLVLNIWRDQLRGKWNRVSAWYSLKLTWQACRAMLRPASQTVHPPPNPVATPMPAPLYTYRQASAFDSPWTRREQVRLLAWESAWSLFCEWTPKPLNPWRLAVLRAFGATLHGRPFVHQRARIQLPWKLTMHDRACLGDGANAYSLGEIEIGARATVAQEAYLCSGTHDFADPALPLQTAPIRVGADAFVGLRAIVLPGVSIGAGSIIGAGSVVTRDIPAGSIAAGNPCRVLRARDPNGLPPEAAGQP